MTEVAILLAVYNGEKYLLELIDSLMKQTYQGFVCYIHDDGSRDNTLRIVRNIKERYPDKIVILEHKPTGSAKANFMSMLNYVKEPYIMFADQDDYWVEDKIEVSLNTIKRLEGVGKKPSLVFTDLEVVDSNLSTTDKSFMKKMGFDPRRIKYQQLMTENIGAGCTMVMNRTLLNTVKRLKNIKNIRMHDGWFMVVAAIYGRIEYIPRQMVLYRQHESNVYGTRKQTVTGKIVSNIKLFCNGKNSIAKKEWLAQIDNMALELLRFGDLPENVRITLNELLAVHDKGKLHRIKFYINNHFMRNRRNLWLLIWV